MPHQKLFWLCRVKDGKYFRSAVCPKSFRNFYVFTVHESGSSESAYLTSYQNQSDLFIDCRNEIFVLIDG
jgi:hypothetical protein